MSVLGLRQARWKRLRPNTCPFWNGESGASIPYRSLEFPAHGATSHVAIELNASGVCESVSTGCTAGLDALYWGYIQLCLRRASAMVVGSAEALLTPFAFGLVCASGVLSKRNDVPQETPRPFELHRDGIVLSEGAGAVVLEELVAGRGTQTPQYTPKSWALRPPATALNWYAAMPAAATWYGRSEIALYHSQLPKDRLDYINAHGVGLRDYDVAETNAIKTVFGKQAYHIPVSSIKSMIGQPFAAGGSLQIVAACLTLQHGIIPPTINYDDARPRL